VRVTNGLRRDAVFLAIFALVACAIATVSWLSVVQERADLGRPIASWQPAVWEFTSVAVLLVLAPMVMAFTRWVEPLQRPWAMVISAHLAATVVFSLIHVTAMGALRAFIFDQLGDFYAALHPLENFLYEFRKDALVYAGMVGLYVQWRRMASTAEAAPAPDTLEVRDGARRRFVAVADILWIEAAGNYVELHTATQAILHRAPLSELERQLGPAFVRVHRSRLVQRVAVSLAESRSTGDYVVRLTDGREVAGSRRYRRPLLEP
jgi:DNA-binding LytR/AlgR family response regulator